MKDISEWMLEKYLINEQINGLRKMNKQLICIGLQKHWK